MLLQNTVSWLNPHRSCRRGERREPGPPASWPRPSPKVARNLGTLTFLGKDERAAMRATDAGPGPRGLAPASSLPPGLVPQKSHVIWVPSLFLGPEKTLQFQRSQFKS